MHIQTLFSTLFLAITLAAPSPNPDPFLPPSDSVPGSSLENTKSLPKRNLYYCCFGILTNARQKFIYIPNTGGPYTPYNPFDSCEISIDRRGPHCGTWTWTKMGRSCNPIEPLRFLGVAGAEKCR